VDRAFPPTAKSVGPKRGKKVRWSKASELAAYAAPHRNAAKRPGAAGRPCLFNKGPDAADVDQGSLGDCYLMSAFACAAEVPGLVESLFITREYSPRGRYVVRLYDANVRRWKRVVVDEWIPTQDGAPAFAQPAGNEMWVMLLEKAFAKHCGSYENMEGGHGLWALQAITGDHVFALVRKKGAWDRLDLVNTGDRHDRRGVEFRPVSDERRGDDDLFELLLQYHRKGSMLGASKSSRGELVDAARGVVAGHAYSVLQIVDIRKITGQRVRLVQLRNPWGSTPWKGAWSDGSAEWAKNRDIREQLYPVGATGAGALTETGASDGGTFWMSWEDFVRTWDFIDVCDRSSGLRDLALDYNEEDGILGPLIGCMSGCVYYWLCCAGCLALYCKHHSSSETQTLEPWPLRCARGFQQLLGLWCNSCARCWHRCCRGGSRGNGGNGARR